MKRFYVGETELYVGTAREIKNLYRNLYEKTVYWSLFVDEPKFNMEKMYGIQISYTDGWDNNSYTILGETAVVYQLLGILE